MLNNKNILITGGTGSFGKKMVQIILENYAPNKLIVFSRDELKQFEMSQRWDAEKYPCIRYFLGDVRDKDRLMLAFRQVDYVIHAAALKQVPAAEYNPAECIKTNVIGAMNVIEAAIYNNVSRVIALSTDKACNPLNLYGATKLCADKLFCAAKAYGGFQNVRFAVVRYGNVLGSRGSVVPFFKEKAKAGVIPITDPRMTRFWITLDQAVHFVLMALKIVRGGEVFVPQIPSMKIVDLARAIDPECRFDIIGVRPGEKLHETLISGEEARHTVEFREHFIIQSHPRSLEELLSAGNGNAGLCRNDFKYTSDQNKDWLTVEQLRDLIEKTADDYSIEKSRWGLEAVPQ
ncbi:MAG: UDP-N-acetylglucosamine 4,6-dehydratase (inverting) [Deltaproteobacteria bacterium]|nr:UDP-N-acetylglucosamine 4,6-dehydratase (inverting) [Deltaproteobacteria bacterium]